MGAALAVNFDRGGHDVSLCGSDRDASLVRGLKQDRQHPSLGHWLPERIEVLSYEERVGVLGDCDILVLAVASAGVREVVTEAGGLLPQHAVVAVASKGWDAETALPLSKVIAEAAPGRSVVIIVGPTLANQIAIGTPTAFVCASDDDAAADRVARAMSSATVRAFTSDDVAGVEVGAAMKNVLAIAIGMCDGVEESRGRPMTNAKAALFSRGLIEMSELSVALGGRRNTVIGLSGAGDLFVTVLGGRNGRFGRLVGAGLEPKKAFAEMGTTVEGYENAAEAVALADKHGLSLPIVRMVHEVLYTGVDPERAIGSLMSGPVEQELRPSP